MLLFEIPIVLHQDSWEVSCSTYFRNDGRIAICGFNHSEEPARPGDLFGLGGS